jgi:hypothetical protein
MARFFYLRWRPSASRLCLNKEQVVVWSTVFARGCPLQRGCSRAVLAQLLTAFAKPPLSTETFRVVHTDCFYWGPRYVLSWSLEGSRYHFFDSVSKRILWMDTSFDYPISKKPPGICREKKRFWSRRFVFQSFTRNMYIFQHIKKQSCMVSRVQDSGSLPTSFRIVKVHQIETRLASRQRNVLADLT